MKSKQPTKKQVAEMKEIFKPHYSGDKSETFWDCINDAGERQGELYSLGVALQNLEHQVLKALNEAITETS